MAPARSPRSHKEKQAAADSKPAAAPEPPKVPLKDQRAHEAGTRRARLILVAVPLALLVWAVYDDVYAQVTAPPPSPTRPLTVAAQLLTQSGCLRSRSTTTTWMR